MNNNNLPQTYFACRYTKPLMFSKESNFHLRIARLSEFLPFLKEDNTLHGSVTLWPQGDLTSNDVSSVQRLWSQSTRHISLHGCPHERIRVHRLVQLSLVGVFMHSILTW